jgi:peptidyl-dipeptidase Dcp
MTTTDGNPLLEPWTGPFGAPPFMDVRVEHFRPALDIGMAEQRAEIDAIAGNPETPSFDNTIAALERSGFDLDRAGAVFFNLAGADTNEEIQAIERDVAPLLARHSNEINLNEKLFARIASLWECRATLGLDAEQARVLERYHRNFLRAGAGLDAAGKARLAEITERLATLSTLFGQNVLADEKGFKLVLDGEEDLAGLPDFVRAAAAQAAEERGESGKHVITLSRSSIEPFLQFSRRRDLREKAFIAWSRRGENDGPNDNRPIMAEMIALRSERAKLMGFGSFADFRLDDTMAKTPAAARELLDTVWTPARLRAAREEADLQALAAAEGGNFRIAPWDWRYYSEAVRRQRFDFDEAELKPYLQLESIIEAAFYTANRLFGLSFNERFDVPTYHLDVRVWEVTGAGGEHVGLFFGDYFARSSKRSGAWMSSFRDQQKLIGNVRPIVVNVMNFSKPPEGGRALLSFDDAHTLFHEFGHALHGLLSDVTYPLISGTSVARDFVELPSQLYEHWLEQPEVLSRFAVHAETGAPMPESWRSKRRRSTGSRCPPRSPCGTAARIFPISSRAAMRPATIPTSGRKCSTPTPSPPSRRPATSSTPRPRSGSTTSSIRPATGATRRKPIRASVAGCRRARRSCGSAGSPTIPEPRRSMLFRDHGRRVRANDGSRRRLRMFA